MTLNLSNRTFKSQYIDTHQETFVSALHSIQTAFALTAPLTNKLSLQTDRSQTYRLTRSFCYSQRTIRVTENRLIDPVEVAVPGSYKVFDDMTTLSITPIKKRATVDSGHRFDASRHWAAFLTLGFSAYAEGDSSITRMNKAQHYGPLRVQRPFYPEGRDGCCHVYLLHPPGGLASGDALQVEISVESGAHTLITTPSANKLYKADSNGVAWSQTTHLKIADGATLEWLPQETLAFDGSRGQQTLTIELQDSAKCLGWEILGLGRPASELPFATGLLEQHFQLTRNGRPLWLERQSIDPSHARFTGKWGQGGASVHATLWAVGLSEPTEAISALREHIPAAKHWAVTYRREVLLLRYLGTERNQAWQLFQQARDILRPLLTGQPAVIPRIWLT